MEKLTKGWVHHLRKTARQETANRGSCAPATADAQPDIDSSTAFAGGEGTRHLSPADEVDIEKGLKNMNMQGPQHNHSAPNRAPEATGPGRPPRKRPNSGRPDLTDPSDSTDRQLAETDERGNKKIYSSPTPAAQQRGTSPPTPRRSRARPDDGFDSFARGRGPKNPGGRQLWSPDDEFQPRTPLSRHNRLASSGQAKRSPQSKGFRQAQQQNVSYGSIPSDSVSTSEMIRQPETKPISQEQLLAEVRSIYRGIVLIEMKCIEYDSSQEGNQLTQEQYHALVALHRSALNEHHDFFLASQHPAASDGIRYLAYKYTMPSRMWRHGIHDFLELLRHKLPDSLEHMLTFIYSAYSMMALLYETVPAFENSWIECLGDLGRYRMAIEDDDIRDRETWIGVSQYWYSKASDKSPATGRLYHHLAILARPNALQQLYYYAKSLCVPIPFESARESIMTLFDPLLSTPSQDWLEPVDAAFVRVHGILFSGKSKEQLKPSMDEFLSLLDGRIGSARSGWLESGYFIGISLSCSLLGFGSRSNVLMRAISTRSDDTDASTYSDECEASEEETFQQALSFAIRTYEIVLRRWGDKNILSCLHTTMVFLLHMSRVPAAMAHIENVLPWKVMSIMLNYLLKTIEIVPRIDTDAFPGPEKEGHAPNPLPEDYALRGLVFAEDYFPEGWFDNEKIDESERYLEPPSKAVERQERILWIGRRLASTGKWLTWDDSARRFSVTDTFNTAEGLADEASDWSAREDSEMSQST